MCESLGGRDVKWDDPTLIPSHLKWDGLGWDGTLLKWDGMGWDENANGMG